jgi:hypothetical protein
MPNITVNIPSEHYRKGRLWAAQAGTSISGAFRLFIQHLPALSPARLGVPAFRDRPAPAPARAACEQCALAVAKSLLPAMPPAAASQTGPAAQPQADAAAKSDAGSAARQAGPCAVAQADAAAQSQTGRAAAIEARPAVNTPSPRAKTQARRTPRGGKSR